MRILIWRVGKSGTRQRKPTRPPLSLFYLTMNSLVSRYASTSLDNELHDVDGLEDDSIPESMWGSSAGFGNLSSKGLQFAVPAVHDVRFLEVNFVHRC